MNKMTASNIWYSGKLCKAENQQKRGPDYLYQYDPKDPGFKAIQEAAVVCSVANFDRSLPADRVNAVRNDTAIKPEQKEEMIREMEREWNESLKNMKYLDMPTTGDASESGLIKFFQPIEDINAIRDRYPVVRDN
jgi:sodium/potassium-transporting ATPase subunit alpha